MAKTQTPGEALQAELAALRQSDEERAKRVQRIEALQLPAMQEALHILATRPIGEAMPDLIATANGLTDNRQSALSNLFAHLDYAQQHFAQEIERIQAQVEADAQAEGEAAA